MRKPSLILLSVLLRSVCLQAQTHDIDSIKSLVNAHSQQDSTKVRLWNSLTRELLRANAKAADSLADLSIALASRINDVGGRGLALAMKGAIRHNLSDDSLAYRFYDESEKMLQKIQDKRGLAYLYRMRAVTLMDDGRHAESLDNFLKGLKLAQEAGDLKMAIDIEGTIGYFYNIIGDPQKAIPYQTDALKQSLAINYRTGITSSYNAIGKTYKTTGNYPASLDAYTKGLLLDEQAHDSTNIFVDHSNIGDVYERMGNYPMALFHLRKAYAYIKQSPKSTLKAWDEWALAKTFTHSGHFDSGMFYAKNSLQHAYQLGYRLYLGEMTQVMAEAAAGLKQWDTAYKYQLLSSRYRDSLVGAATTRKTAILQAGYDLDKKQTEITLLRKDKELQLAESKKEKAFLFMLLGGLAAVLVLAVILLRNNRQKQKANVLLKQQKELIDEKAIQLAAQKNEVEQAYKNVERLGDIGRKITASLAVEKIISTVYDQVNTLMDAAVFGIGIYNEALRRIEFPATYEKGHPLPPYSNSIGDENRFDVLCFRSGNEIVMGNLSEDHKNYIQSIPKPKADGQTVSVIYLPLKIKEKKLGVITVQSFKKDAYSDYALYMLRNISVYIAIALENAESYNALNETLSSLKKTQAQLIQSEKMASLGELTAGIAHEIQNPLNFVNNFSEVNKELLTELKEEADKGNFDEVKAITNDVIDNSEKINYHGKRADAIVKGMLQHSRNSTGKKEPTNINALCDEYLRLAYYGLRAKDKSFNATLQTDYDESVDAVNTIPQDIGRVVLNLLTNAFYAVTEKKAKTNDESYKPTVIIATKKQDDKVVVTVADNGAGIPSVLREKIFQPFFTTKPTGQGTGLGLSMSYDIVTKGHGGEMKVDSVANEGSVFTISLPA